MPQINHIREQFPALSQAVGDGGVPVFFDGPGGTQVPRSVLSAMMAYLGRFNANLGAPYFTSERTTKIMDDARQHYAALINAPLASQIVFGPTATALMFNFSRAISRHWRSGDEIIVTALDHYSNVSSWIEAAKDKGVKVHQVPIDPMTFDINYDALEQLINHNTKLVACTYASNTIGTIADLERVIEMARNVGALSFIDAVHYAPHQLIDVQALDCDFLVTSAYKFMGPHLSMLYAKQSHLEHFEPYKVHPAPNNAPNRWEQGTQNFEAMAGLSACIKYLSELPGDTDADTPLRTKLSASYQKIAEHETVLGAHFLKCLSNFPNITLYGKRHVVGRTPTFAFRIGGRQPREFAEFCGKHFICVGDGHFYAQGLCEQLGVMNTGGVIRVGFMHYNTVQEIDAFFTVLDRYLHKI